MTTWTWIARQLRRARMLLTRSNVESEMDEEMRYHLEMETEHLMGVRGLSRDEAAREARIAFGGVERYKEQARDARGLRPVEDAVRDVAHALRTLRRSPGFSAVTVLTLGLGMGAVLAMFALVHSILIRPLPYRDADRLVAVGHAAPGLGLTEAGLSSGTFFHYRDRARSLDGLAVYLEAVVNLAGGEGAAERFDLAMSGPELFRLLGVRPLVGRLFTEEEAERFALDMTGPLPVLLGEGLWERRYGRDPDIVGRTVFINTRAREVVGILPEGFSFPRPTTQVWMVLDPPAATANFARDLGYDAVGRLRPGVGPDDAETELTALLPSIEGEYDDATPDRLAEVRLRPVVVPLEREIVGDTGTVLWILLGGMAVLLLVGCANLANLFLVRSEYRAGEMAVRTALGARRADLRRLFLAEAGLLALAGTGAALGLADAALRVFVSRAPVQLPRLHEVTLDAPVVGVALGLAAAIALVLTWVAGARHDTGGLALRSGGRGAVERGTSRGTRDVLVAGQVALALTLLAASALMVRSFLRLADVDPGFDPDGALIVEMGLPGRLAPDHKRIYDELLARLGALPGVTGAAAATDLPLVRNAWTEPPAFPIRVPDRPAGEDGAGRTVALKYFTPGYFGVMGVPVLEGVAFDGGRWPDAPHPVVISAGLATRLFPGQDAVGKRIRRLASTGEEVRMYDRETGTLLDQPDYTVVGVVGDVRQASLREPPAEAVYLPVLDPGVDPQLAPTELNLVLRWSSGTPPPLTAVRQIVAEVNPSLGIARIRTLEAIVGASTARESFLAVLLVIAGVTSLFLGAVGVYGVVSYVVGRRTRELGLRVALGASARDVVGLVLGDSARVVVAGIAVGTLATLLSARVLRSLLFEVSPADPVALFGVVAVLLPVTLLAAAIPARRAARADPMEVLRTE